MVCIVCNGGHPNLVFYFKSELNALKKNHDILVFKNNTIKVDNFNSINSSYTLKTFFDFRLFIDFFISFKLIYEILKNKVNVVHFTTAHASNIFLACWLKLFDVEQIFTIHDLIPHPGFKSRFIEYYNLLIIKIFSNKIITFSHGALKKFKNKKKFHVMKLAGFTQNVFEPKIGNDIIFFGRIDEYKGLSILYRIAQESLKRKLNWRFVIAGYGYDPNIELLKSLENTKIINRFINEDEISDLFLNSAFTILPYTSATQSGVAILSYSYGTPVIANDVGQLNEYIIDDYNGKLFKLHKEKEIVDYISNISYDRIFELSNNCLKDFTDNYSLSSLNKQYINFFDKYN